MPGDNPDPRTPTTVPPPASGAPRTALVRAVSPRLAEAELTFLDRVPIDVARAQRQHTDYRRALARLGLEVVALPPAPDHPDGVFVEDTVIVVDDLAVLTRPGAPSRRAEPDSVGPTLLERGLEVVRITAPGHLDGGDVLQVTDTLYVGVGARTDTAGAEQLAAAVARRGRRVVPVPVPGALHLKTAVTALPDGTLVGRPELLGCAELPGVPLPPATGSVPVRPIVSVPEPAGANVLLVGDTVVVSASAPATAALIAARGFEVVVVEVDELEKAESGVTCMSVLLA